MTSKHLGYWVTTGLFCLVLAGSGVNHLLHVDFMVENMTALGYPVYFMTIIGAFKLLGVGALLAPKLPLLKEWAYAGFTFNLIGATASHFYSGDSFGHAIMPALVLVVGLLSYALRPESRRLVASPSFAKHGADDSESPLVSA
jgi:hypothetical protein